jgi:hypothetical protein
VARLRILSVAGALVVLSLSLAGAGCSKKEEMKKEEMILAARQDAEFAKEAPAQGKQPAGGEQAGGPKAPAKEALPRKIIYTATARLIVEDFIKAQQELERLIEANQGYLVQSGLHGAPPAPRSGEWKARIPVEKFKAFQAVVVKLGELQSSNLDSQDVTEEFYELKKHIENREAREAAVRQMYDTWSKKATKVEDILPIDREIAQVRQEIERAQGRMQVLSRLSELATMTVYLTERKGYVPPESPDFGARVGRTFSGSLEALQDFGQALALVAVALGPWLPLLIVIVVPLWIVVRRHRRAGAARAAPPLVEVVEPPRPEGGAAEGEPRP